MKYLLTVSAILLVSITGFSGCSNQASTQKNAPAADVGAANTSSSPDNTASKSSEYPPAPSAVAQSEIKTLDNSTFKIEDKKGKVLLLNLWATWCGPCRAEMPHLNEMQENYRDKNFEIIGLNVDDETVEQIKPFAEEMKLNYTLAWADDKMNDELLKFSKFGGIPQSFLIDRNGNMRGVFVGGSKKVIDKMMETVESVVNE